MIIQRFRRVFVPNWLTFLTVTWVIAATGCKEKDVPFVVDSEEIERIISESSNGRELFRTDGLIPQEPYVLGIDSATYEDSVVSKSRDVNVILADTAVDYGSLGMLREAFAAVTDRFTVRTRRTIGASARDTMRVRTFVRYGFFLKLGDDSQDFVGWKLHGFNGYAGSPLITMIKEDNSVFSGDDGLYNRRLLEDSLAVRSPRYIRLTEMRTVPKGSRLGVQVVTGFEPVVTHSSSVGFSSLGLTERGVNIFLDTVTTPATNPRLYDLVVLNLMKDSSSVPGQNGVFVPYRTQ